MTRKLKLVPVLLLFLMASAFTNPNSSTGGSGTPTGGTPVVECKFWGEVKATSWTDSGCILTVTHHYIFWIETSVDIDLDCPN